MERFFKLKQRNTTIKKEILAGITIFFSMAYVLFVVPMTLAEANMNQDAVFTAVALSASLACIFMGLYANFPVAIASGMGMQAFFAYTIVGRMGYSWQEALFAIFVSGIIFILISVSGLRQIIINSIPISIKYAVTAGIGLFIAFIGMQSIGLIVGNDSTLVGLGNMQDPVIIVALIGVIISFIFVARENNMGIFLTMFIVAVVGVFLNIFGIDMGIELPNSIVSAPASIQPVFGQLFSVDIASLLTDYNFWMVVLSILFVGFFDATGTIIAISGEAGFTKEDGSLEGAEKALIVDSISTTVGAIFGTSSLTVYVESMTGIKVGGRTGLTAIVTGICFLISMLFTPLLSVIGAYVTAPALITVGALMMKNVAKIDYSDFADAAAVFMTVLMMVVTYSISEGISFGFITYTLVKLGEGKRKDIHLVVYILTVLFLLHYCFI